MSRSSVRSLSTAGLLSAALLSMSFTAEQAQAPATPQNVSVPNVVGMTVDEARAALKAVGLSSDFGTRPTVETADQKLIGRVAKQDPGAGAKVRQRSVVNMERYGPMMAIAVPDLMGYPELRATNFLNALHFSLKRVEAATADRQQSGKVIRQEPSPGTKIVPGTAAVTIVIGVAPADVVVPNLKGMDPSQANRTLTGLGLSPQNLPGKVPTSDQRQLGMVAEQSPAAGARVSPGTPVMVKVYGRDIVTVPGVIRAMKADATATLQKAGFSVTVRDIKAARPEDVGKVIRQDPEGGKDSIRGAPVLIIVAVP